MLGAPHRFGDAWGVRQFDVPPQVRCAHGGEVLACAGRLGGGVCTPSWPHVTVHPENESDLEHDLALVPVGIGAADASYEHSTASFRERRWYYKDSYSSSSSIWSFAKIHSKLNECTTTKDDFFVIVDLR